MAFIIPSDYSISSPYSYSPDIIVNIDNERYRNRNYKIESIPVTSSYFLPDTTYYNNSLNTSYFYPTTYSYPVFQNISYLDVNADKDLHKKVTKHFYSQLYNKWIPELYPNLLNYLKISGSDVHLIKSITEAKNNTTKEDEFRVKINYLADFIITKKDLYEILSVYSDRKNIKWWNMRQYSDDVEIYVIKRLEQKLKEMILE
jgi:hypothetical protein